MYILILGFSVKPYLQEFLEKHGKYKTGAAAKRVICSDHFDPQDMILFEGQATLKPFVLPSLGIPESPNASIVQSEFRFVVPTANQTLENVSMNV